MNDKEIVFSQSIKAGKRIYYLDVKKNRKDEMFLAITESKKIVMGEGDDSQVSFEKHKTFYTKKILKSSWTDSSSHRLHPGATGFPHKTYRWRRGWNSRNTQRRSTTRGKSLPPGRRNQNRHWILSYNLLIIQKEAVFLHRFFATSCGKPYRVMVN